MTLTLELPRELEIKLNAEAERLGLPLEKYALRRLGEALETTDSVPRNGAELVAYWHSEGVIGSRPDIENSQTHARELRRQAEQRD